MAGQYDRRRFLARLLLLSASVDSGQGSTSLNSCACHAARVTFEESDREKQRRKHTPYVVDSGATLHCINDISLFDTIDQDHPQIHLRVANGKVITAKAVGTVKLRLVAEDGSTSEIVLHNVVYHPSFSHNLLSVRRLWRDNRIKTRFGSRNYFKQANTGKKFNFEFHSEFKVQSIMAVSDHKGVSPDILHSRLGHCGNKRLRQCLARSINFPQHETLDHDPRNCDACQAGAAKRQPFPKRPIQKFTVFGQRLSSDLCGPFQESVEGYTYMLNIVDAATNIMEVYYLKSKSSAEVKAAFEHFLIKYKIKLEACRAAGHDVNWRTDNGGEFMSADLDAFLHEFSVVRSFSTPYAPPQNAHAERMWGIILRCMRTTMAESGISERFWTFAAANAVMLHNSLPSTKLPNSISPSEALTGKKPDLSRFRVFGCIAWYFLPEHERSSKLGPRSLPAINLGCDPTRKGWILYIPQLNRITTGYHITFQERRFMKFTDHSITAPSPPSGLHHPPRRVNREARDGTPGDLSPDSAQLSPANEFDSGVDLFDDDGTPRIFQDDGALHREFSDDEDTFGEDHCEDTECTLPRGHGGPHSHERVGTRREGSTRVRQQAQPSTYERNYIRVVMEDSTGHFFEMAANVNLGDIQIPKNYNEAIESRFEERWRAAMLKEITDLLRNETWDLVDRDQVPAGKRITKSRWVYDLKYLRDGTIERFKARFVACGYSQVYGKDFTHTFSATLRATSFRLFLAIAAGRKLQVHQFDVTSAFTQADMDAEIYVDPPKGFESKGKDGQPRVLRLKKALYGTKQAARLWQQALIKRLIAMGFKQSPHDPCIFRYVGKHGECLIGAYVDDLLCACSSPDTFAWFSSLFLHSDTNPDGFYGKHLGKVNYFLGMAIDQYDDYSISVHQMKFITKMLDKFIPSHQTNSIKHHKPCSPESFSKLSTAKDDLERERMAALPYLELVGSLLYVAGMTRPDVAYYVTTLCKFMHDPSPECYDAAISLLLYLGHTKDFVGLHYDGCTKAPSDFGRLEPDSDTVREYIESNYGFVAYSDASWRSAANKYSSYGYVVYLFGGVVSFASKYLKIVAMSSAEAEYAAASQACREMAYIRNVCADLGLTLKGRLCLGVDNSAAIAICENPGITARNKHFDDQIHYVRHDYEHQRVRVVYVPTDRQRADGFTKPLDPTTFFRWRENVVPANHPPV